MIIARNGSEVGNTRLKVFDIRAVYLEFYFIRSRYKIVRGRSVTARDELDRVVEDELMDILLRWYVLLNLIDEHVMLVERDVFTLFFVQ